jgi:hypothetical protein
MVEEAPGLDVFPGRLGAPHRRTACRVVTADETVAAIDRPPGDVGRHGKAARALAEKPFDPATVLGQLVEEVG